MSYITIKDYNLKDKALFLELLRNTNDVLVGVHDKDILIEDAGQLQPPVLHPQLGHIEGVDLLLTDKAIIRINGSEIPNDSVEVRYCRMDIAEVFMNGCVLDEVLVGDTVTPEYVLQRIQDTYSINTEGWIATEQQDTFGNKSFVISIDRSKTISYTGTVECHGKPNLSSRVQIRELNGMSIPKPDVRPIYKQVGAVSSSVVLSETIARASKGDTIFTIQYQPDHERLFIEKRKKSDWNTLKASYTIKLVVPNTNDGKFESIGCCINDNDELCIVVSCSSAKLGKCYLDRLVPTNKDHTMYMTNECSNVITPITVSNNGYWIYNYLNKWRIVDLNKNTDKALDNMPVMDIPSLRFLGADKSGAIYAIDSSTGYIFSEYDSQRNSFSMSTYNLTEIHKRLNYINSGYDYLLMSDTENKLYSLGQLTTPMEIAFSDEAANSLHTSLSTVADLDVNIVAIDEKHSPHLYNITVPDTIKLEASIDHPVLDFSTFDYDFYNYSDDLLWFVRVIDMSKNTAKLHVTGYNHNSLEVDVEVDVPNIIGISDIVVVSGLLVIHDNSTISVAGFSSNGSPDSFNQYKLTKIPEAIYYYSAGVGKGFYFSTITDGTLESHFVSSDLSKRLIFSKQSPDDSRYSKLLGGYNNFVFLVDEYDFMYMIDITDRSYNSIYLDIQKSYLFTLEYNYATKTPIHCFLDQSDNRVYVNGITGKTIAVEESADYKLLFDSTNLPIESRIFSKCEMYDLAVLSAKPKVLMAIGVNRKL